MKQGPSEKRILPNILRLGRPIPKAIAEAPTLSPGLELYMEAYSSLSTTRGGMGDGPIPWTAAMQYADRLGLDSEDAEELWYYVSEMDVTWSEYQTEKRAKKEAAGG